MWPDGKFTDPDARDPDVNPAYYILKAPFDGGRNTGISIGFGAFRL